MSTASLRSSSHHSVRGRVPTDEQPTETNGNSRHQSDIDPWREGDSDCDVRSTNSHQRSTSQIKKDGGRLTRHRSNRLILLRRPTNRFPIERQLPTCVRPTIRLKNDLDWSSSRDVGEPDEDLGVTIYRSDQKHGTESQSSWGEGKGRWGRGKRGRTSVLSSDFKDFFSCGIGS